MERIMIASISDIDQLMAQFRDAHSKQELQVLMDQFLVACSYGDGAEAMRSQIRSEMHRDGPMTFLVASAAVGLASVLLASQTE